MTTHTPCVCALACGARFIEAKRQLIRGQRVNKSLFNRNMALLVVLEDLVKHKSELLDALADADPDGSGMVRAGCDVRACVQHLDVNISTARPGVCAWPQVSLGVFARTLRRVLDGVDVGRGTHEGGDGDDGGGTAQWLDVARALCSVGCAGGTSGAASAPAVGDDAVNYKTVLHKYACWLECGASIATAGWPAHDATCVCCWLGCLAVRHKVHAGVPCSLRGGS